MLVFVAAGSFMGVLWTLSLLAMIQLMPGPQAMWDAASEANVWTWGNAVLFILGAGGALDRGFAPGTLRTRLAWLALAGALFLLSLDDVASFHERLDPLGRQMGGGDGATHFAWVIPGAVIGLVALIGFAFCARVIGGRAGQLVLCGAGVFFLGALGLEVVSGAHLAGGGSNLTYALLYHVEEAVEAGGAALLLAAGYAPGRGELARTGLAGQA